jgi:hypothetical protein
MVSIKAEFTVSQNGRILKLTKCFQQKVSHGEF